MTREEARIELCVAQADVWYRPSDDAIDMAIKALEQEPKIGHWVHSEYCDYCSECGCDIPAYIIDWKWHKDVEVKYCPQCGSKMESEAGYE